MNAPIDQSKIALVAGGGGLVGGHLIQALLRAPEYSRVIALSRRPLPIEHGKVANRIINFVTLEKTLAGTKADDAFCALGTTIRKAGSEDEFRLVDYDYVLSFARAAAQAGARRLVVVSSVGANRNSKNLYLRVKGEIEDQLRSLNLPATDILQPGLLFGMRPEIRPLEIAGQAAMTIGNLLLHGEAAKYRAISAETVGRAMLGAARTGRKSFTRYTHVDLQRLAKWEKPAYKPLEPKPAQ
ncbi:MAG: NAD(P)H-binding protein [Steroidobacterales bacterium]